MTSKEYEAALATANAAGAKFREAQVAYRAKKIDDAAYLAARAVYEASEEAFDAAWAAEEKRSS